MTEVQSIENRIKMHWRTYDRFIDELMILSHIAVTSVNRLNLCISHAPESFFIVGKPNKNDDFIECDY
jgi:hypothetical protein